MTNGNYTVSKEVLDAMAKDAGLSPSFVNDVLDIMATNKAKSAASLPDSFFGPGGLDVPSKPHLSYDGKTVVSKGDYVDWTDPKTGKVYRGYVVNVRYMHDSKKYLYSDQTLVIFPELNAEQGYESTRQRHRVSSNLVVVDKEAPMTEPFYPKSKEAMSQEDVTTGKTAEYVPAPKVAPQKTETPEKPETPNAPAEPQQSFEDMYGGPDHAKGDVITNPATGVTGEVVASWVGPGGFKGFTIQTKDGQKISFNNEDNVTTTSRSKRPLLNLRLVSLFSRMTLRLKFRCQRQVTHTLRLMELSTLYTSSQVMQQQQQFLELILLRSGLS
jgi:hypothetical protein